jgi:hypothetical protein
MVPLCISAGGLLLLVPLELGDGTPANEGLRASVALAGVAFAVTAFWWIQPGMDDCPTNTPRWLRQALVAGLASLLGLFDF